MKKLIVFIMCVIIFTPFAYTYDIDKYEGIDPVSLEILIKEGLIIEDDREKYINLYNKTLTDYADVKDDNIIKESDKDANSQVDLVIGEFLVESIRILSDDSIYVKFNQKLSANADFKSYYSISEDGKVVFKYSDIETRRVGTGDAVIIKLKTSEFKKDTDYKLLLNNSLKSRYNIAINSGKTYAYDFKSSNENLSNEEVISYSVYQEGYIDVRFKYEVSENFLNSKSNFNISFNDGKFILACKNISLIEDEDGLARTIRVFFSEFYEKYDYIFTIKNLNLANSVHTFPGGASLGNSFVINDINVIDNYTICLNLNTKLDYTSKKGFIRLSGGADLDNFELYDDKIILHFKKDGGLKFLSEYNVHLIDFVSLDNRELASINYTFLTEDSSVYKDYKNIEVTSAKWVGDNYIKIDFNKAVDLSSNVSAYIKVKDENSNYVSILSSYQIEGQSIILKLRKGTYGDSYKLEFMNIPEKGNQFRSESKSILVVN